VTVESGIKGGRTTGGRIRMVVKNRNAIPSHYSSLRAVPRPGHADYPAYVKYGKVEPGGGFFSGRMTVAFVMAGAVAKKMLEARGISTMAFATQIGNAQVERRVGDGEILENTYQNPVHTAANEKVGGMAREVEAAGKAGDSVGGIVECRICGVPAGMGEPMFSSIESRLSQAVFGIPGAKGIEFGSGFAGAALRGSQNNDGYFVDGGKVAARTNNAGGVLGGLSTGMPIAFRVAFKPTSSISKPQKSVNLEGMGEEELRITGRHDPCIAIRAVPVVECIAAVAMADIVLGEGKRGGR
jgi:chorismate synthase